MTRKNLIFLLAAVASLMRMTAQTYNYYYGNIHSHTSYSDGNKDSATSLMTKPIQAFNYAKNSQHIDFYGVAEHNHASAGMASLASYHQGIADANAANNDGTFVAMYGFEWGVISGGGHVIVYGCDSLMGWDNSLFDIYVPQSDYTTLWKKVKARPNAFAYLCHPNTSDFGGILTTSVNATADSAIVGTAGRSGPAFSTNSTYSDPSTGTYITQYNYALRQGYHVGIGLDHDTHNSVFGRQSAGRLVVMAQSLTRANVYDAFKKMRFYCSDDWNVKVNFQIQNQPMGSIITHSGTPTLSVTVTDPDAAESVSSIAIYAGVPGSGANPTVLTSVTNSASLVYTHAAAANNSKYYYYILITQADGDKIWTSPIWYNRNDAYVVTTPVANFTQSTAKVCINQPLLLSDASTNAPTSWTWTAVGASPSVSYIQNCNFTYTTSGTYTVSLVAANSAGISTAYTQTITVLPTLPTPTISVSGLTLTSSPATGYQWYVNNYMIPGATSQTLTAPYDGVYTVVATDVNACNSARSNTIMVSVSTVGIKNNELYGSLTIYPNPTTGIFTIEINNLKNNASIELINELGQTIRHSFIKDCSSKCLYDVDLKDYPNGIYFVKIKSDNQTEYRKLLLNK
ncbi:MAG: T9SS type A sorting domain-containing protein [Bacteroidetes bacterium]|nr:T9SS type A sorting domain-containing protein [Bacteroidota bacterium]